jgi:G3E family GTPase
MKQALRQIPTNLITGFLGVGKSTTIAALLAQKPNSERWAILVNEFGEIGVDGTILTSYCQHDRTVFIQEVAGGCLCCATNVAMKVALNQLLKRSKPHRLLIEPTGLGHPRRIINALQAPEYETVLDLRATITLVDARKIDDDRYIKHPIFNQQLDIADLIVAHKSDLYQGHEVETLLNYLCLTGHSERPIYPAQQGKISASWLDFPRFSAQNGTTNGANSAAEGAAYHSYGWLYGSEICFQYRKIDSIFREIPLFRLKAAIRTERGFFAFNRIEETLLITPLEPLQQSKIEAIDLETERFTLLENGLNGAVVRD